MIPKMSSAPVQALRPAPSTHIFKNQLQLNHIQRSYFDIGCRLALDIRPRLATATEKVRLLEGQLNELQQQPTPVFALLKKGIPCYVSPERQIQKEIKATLDLACLSIERQIAQAYTNSKITMESRLSNPQNDPSDVQQLHHFYFIQELESMKDILIKAGIVDIDKTQHTALVLHSASTTDQQKAVSHEFRCSLPSSLEWNFQPLLTKDTSRVSLQS